jgi:lysophospholipase L1-like esterase
MGPVGPRFIGRFDRTDPAALGFAWSGTAIALRFKGTAIGVTLTDSGSNFFEVVVDDQHTVLSLQQGTKKYSLASNLSNAAHDVLLYRRSEAFFGETKFNGFDVDASAYLSGPPVASKRLEVIGDSISAGYGNEGTLPCAFEAKTENHYLTYEALAARTLGAELYTEAWSGIGMLRNNDGSTTGTMPELYPRTLPERATSAWDFSAFVPDAVVINLGTNDFAKGDPMQAFQTTYTTFVTGLRGHYPKARFYLAVGSMLGGADYDKAKSYLEGVIAARKANGDSNVVVLPFATQDSTDGLGCDYHPSLKTHQKMADKLVAALKADLGW